MRVLVEVETVVEDGLARIKGFNAVRFEDVEGGDDAHSALAAAWVEACLSLGMACEREVAGTTFKIAALQSRGLGWDWRPR